MSGQKTMFGGRNKKRAKKRQERNRQQNKHRRERKAREQVRLADLAREEGVGAGSSDGSSSATTSSSSFSSVDEHNQRRASTDAAVAAVLKAKGYSDDADAPPENKMSRSKRKKLARLASEREKKKHRSELFAQLAANALSTQQQSMLQSTATLGQKQTMRQRLKSDLMKQRAGMEIDEASSRLEVRMMPVVASGSNSVGKWTAPGTVAPPRQVARPFGVSSGSEDDSSSDEDVDDESNDQGGNGKRVDNDVDMVHVLEEVASSSSSSASSTAVPALPSPPPPQDPVSAAQAAAASMTNRPSRVDKKSRPVALDSIASGGSGALGGMARTTAAPTKAFFVSLDRTPEIQEARSKLPVCGMEQEIMEAIAENPFVVLCGETGSGKTTQIPQFLYEAGYGSPGGGRPGMIGVTQPRRVAALAVARRVAEEMNVPYGGEGGKVAHQVRYDARTVGDDTAIKFMTDGILLKEIQSDFLLRKYSAIVLDEAHERNLNTDMLLGLLSRIVPLRSKLLRESKVRVAARAADAGEDDSNDDAEEEVQSELKVIIMSATLRVEDFTENRALFPISVPPVLRVQGRTHPVTVHFSRRTIVGDDYLDAVFEKVSKVHRLLPPGGILVFLTGQREIEALCRRLRSELGVGGRAAGKAVWGKAEDAAQLAIEEAEVDWSAGESDDDMEDEEVEEDALAKASPTLPRNAAGALDGEGGEEEREHETDDEDEGGELLEQEQEDSDAAMPTSKALSVSSPTTTTTSSSSSSPLSNSAVPSFTANAQEAREAAAAKADATPVPLTGVHVLPLYARLAQKRQTQVFEDAPQGKRLIVVATNVAETSITIPGIRYVVDAGRQKDKLYDTNTGLSRFAVQWVSKSSAEQRSGRAGRVGPGHAYRMYSSAVFNDRFAGFAPPEIVNRPIEDLVLQMKAMRIENVSQFPFPTPPPLEEMEAAEAVLAGIGAVDEDFKITPLGTAISQFPVAARYAKMLILAKQRNVLPYAIAVVAGMTVQPPFLYVNDDKDDEDCEDAVNNQADAEALDEETRRKKLMESGAGRKKKKRKNEKPPTDTKKNSYAVHDKWRHSQSDSLTLLRVIGAYSHVVETARNKHQIGPPKHKAAAIKRAASKFCSKHLLHERTLREITLLRRQLRRLAQTVLRVTLPNTLKLRPPSPDQEQLLLQVIAAGLLDRVAMLAPAGTFAVSEGAKDPIEEGDNEARRRALRRLRAAYQSCVPTLRQSALFVPPMSSVREKEIKRLPQFLCYNDIVQSSSGDGVEAGTRASSDGSAFVQMRGLTVIAPEWLSSISAGTTLCEFPAPDAASPPVYNPSTDCVECVTRPRFGTHRWELPLTTVPLARTTVGLEQECRWFLRYLLEGKIGAAALFAELRSKLKISPAVITHSRFHALGLSLVNEAMTHKVTSKRTLVAQLASDVCRGGGNRMSFLLPQLKLWAKGGAKDRARIEELWAGLLRALR